MTVEILFSRARPTFQELLGYSRICAYVCPIPCRFGVMLRVSSLVTVYMYVSNKQSINKNTVGHHDGSFSSETPLLSSSSARLILQLIALVSVCFLLCTSKAIISKAPFAPIPGCFPVTRHNIIPSASSNARNVRTKQYDVCIVGAGLSGAVIAERYASILQQSVLILEKRNHIGGNCFDYIDEETGIRVSKFGAHLFHTTHRRVWDYVHRFAHWTTYEHSVLGLV